MQLTARQIIKNEYGRSKNIMTPTILSYGLLPGGAYELTKGEGLSHDEIWGVSVVQVIDRNRLKTKRKVDLSNVFYSKEEALSHIQKLKKEGIKDE